MRRAVILLALGLAACEPPVERPPAEFQGNRTWTVSLSSNSDEDCRKIMPDAHAGNIHGCTKWGVSIVPNPCLHSGYYAELMCHEMAHANGWKH